MQQIQGAFSATQSTGTPFLRAVLADGVVPTQGYTSGRYSLQQIIAQPTLTRPWTIYGFGVHGQGVLLAGGLPNFGLLGKLYASLLFGGAVSTLSNQPFLTPPQAAVPNLTVLWDGSQDPPFPFYDGTHVPAGGYFQGGLQLPQPQPLQAGDQLAIGLWLTPSLLNEVEVAIANAQWSINYE